MRNNWVFPSFSLKIMENFFFFFNEAQEKVTINDFFQGDTGLAFQPGYDPLFNGRLVNSRLEDIFQKSMPTVLIP